MAMKLKDIGLQKGFSLLEILIGVGILAIVSTLIVQVLFTTTHANKKTKLMSDIKQNGAFALDVMERMVRESSAMTVTATSVEITNPDASVTTFTCRSDGKVARIASVSGTGVVEYLTGGNVTLSTSGGATCADSSLSFQSVDQSLLSITFSLGQSGVAGGAYESARSSFQGTVGVRNQ